MSSSERTDTYTVHLDTANWIDLARRFVPRHTYHVFERAVADRRVLPVVSLAHLIEFAGIEDSVKRGEITRGLEHFDSIGDMRWIKQLYDVIRLEAAACFRGLVDDAWTPPDVCSRSFHSTLHDFARWEFDLETPRRIRDLVEAVRQDEPFVEGFREDRRAYPAERREIAKVRRARRAARFSDGELRAWIADYLPGVIQLPSGLSHRITEDMKAEFLMKADLDQCPAFRVDQAWHEGWNLDPAGASGSDIADCLHAPGLAYCDVAFADKRTVDALRKGRSPKTPHKNSEFSNWVETLGKD
ncbi:hypothetical protein [Candidatus Palauibacter sp.]|uniref:hypothetical protein n=1 Tax=Candidatus Palauibacter sp. TaxID=3101350 RepID=UPI003B01BAEA